MLGFAHSWDMSQSKKFFMNKLTMLNEKLDVLFHPTKRQSEATFMNTVSMLSEKLDDFCNSWTAEARVKGQPLGMQH